jgi:uncharacterized protein with LGFP repeats
MRRNKARFVTACQQSLALGAVLAVLAPAANVISLDVVGTRPGTPVEAAPAAPRDGRQLSAPGTPVPSDHEESRVETAPVEPTVEEVPMQQAADQPADRKRTEIVSKPEKVSGYTAVGVTWSHGTQLADDQIKVMVRTRTDGTWSGWTPIQYHEEHAPDPQRAEGKHARPGTDPLLVGDVDEVQAKAVTTYGEIPADVTMAVVEPGDSKDTDLEEPAIDTSELDSAKLNQSDETVSKDTAEQALESSDGDIALQAGSYTPKPQIYSRAQWGANERMRDKSSLHYYEVHAGFVHHTVNANNYTRDQVPGIIRSIYAYHTQSKGWSDIGYNFLVDRFGRIWEGRYGGVDRPVVGAHTLGYNDYSFAMSAIGNFETAQPTSAMITAYGRLFAWKLSLHGVSASDTSQKVGPKYFKAINGHRDAGSTACPGRYLYAKIPQIRTLAAQYQADWSGRDRTTDVIGSGYPDIMLRRTSDGAGFVLPTGGMMRFNPARLAPSTGWGGYDTVLASPDLTGDGKADVFVRNRAGAAGTRPGTGTGDFSRTVGVTATYAGLDQFTAVGDLNADGRNDLVARNPANGRLLLLAGTGHGTFAKHVLSTRWATYDMTVASGDLNGDGKVDVVSRDKAGALWFHAGTGRLALGTPVRMAGSWSGFDVITGFGDYTADGRADLYARSRSTGLAYVYPGKGNGTVGHWLGRFGRVSGLTSLSSSNVIGTAAPDLVGVKGDRLYVVAHHGTQHTRPVVSVGKAFANANLVLNVGDWDRDGYGDVITRPKGTGTLELRRGLAGGKLAAPVVLHTGFAGISMLSAVGDTTGDGYPDLMGQPSGGALRIYPGNGLKGFRPSYVAHGAVSASRQLGAGRWDGDGAPDNLFRVGDSLRLYRGNGPGGLTGSPTTVTSSLAGYDWVLSAGDVDRDGHADLVVREKATGYLWLLPGRASGVGARKFLAEGFSGYDLAG